MRIAYSDECSTCRQGPSLAGSIQQQSCRIAASRFPLSTSHGGDIYNNSVDIDFSVNLNPYELAGADERAVKDAIAEGIESAVCYPDIRQRDVRAAIAETEGVTADQVYAGSGASQLIMAVTNLVNPKKALLIDPCYSGYEHALASVCDCNIVRYPLKEESGFGITPEVADAITDDTDILFIQDPVNPTGQNVEDFVLEAILDRAKEHDVTVVLDNSFLALSSKADDEAHDRNRSYVNKYNNLFIISSYTKNFALPGLRMGYIMSTKQNIDALIPYLPEWNISSIASSVMKACADISARSDYLAQSRAYIEKERRYLTGALSSLGFIVFDSDTVFILIKDVKGLCPDLYERLLKRRILIRRCDDFYCLDKSFYRIAVRGHEDNMILTDEIRNIINEDR